MAVVTYVETEWKDVPHEPGCRFELRPLSKRELDEASEELMGRVTKRLEPDQLTALDERKGKPREVDPDHPERAFDTATLLGKGIVSWQGPIYEGVTCNRDNRRELDDRTAKWAAHEIALMSVWLDEEKPNAEHGSEANGSDPSPGTSESSSAMSTTPPSSSLPEEPSD